MAGQLVEVRDGGAIGDLGLGIAETEQAVALLGGLLSELRVLGGGAEDKGPALQGSAEVAAGFQKPSMLDVGGKKTGFHLVDLVEDAGGS